MRIRAIWAIARKDLGHFFASPIGYIVLTVFYFVAGVFFYLIAVQARIAEMAPLFQNAVILLLFLTPMITMRLWAEEEKTQTAELLRTSPITWWDIVFGKYLAVCLFGLVMLSVTIVYLFIMLAVGNPDLGVVAANYLGFMLCAFSFFALGLLASTFSENQIVAAVLGYGFLLAIWILSAVGENLEGPIGAFLRYLSMFDHVDDFMRGIVDLSHVFYFLSAIALGLFWSVKILESRGA